MLKVKDVDLIKDHILALAFSDGFRGKVDLSAIFSKPPFSEITDFKRFSLTASGALNWNGNEVSAGTLRELAIGEQEQYPPSIQSMEQVIKQAAWDSMQEDRPDILQAAIRSYVEQYGHKVVIEKAGIKSRTSAYRSLKPQTTPNFGTLVHLCHAVIAIAKEAANPVLAESNGE